MLRISQSSVFYNIFALTLSNIALQVLGFLYRIILSRLIGAEGMGVFQLVSPYYSIMHALALSGLTLAVNQISAEFHAFGDAHSTRRTVRLCFVLFAALFTAVAVPTFLYSEYISVHLLGDERTRTALLIFIPCLLCTGIENIFKNYFFGVNFLKAPIISELTEQSVRILAVAVLLIVFSPENPGDAAALIACGMVISEIVSSSLLSAFYKKCTPRLPHRQHKYTGLYRKILSVAIPVMLTSLITNLLGSANSVLIPRRLIASGMAHDSALSLFGTLFGMTMPLLTFPIAFIAPLTTVTVPKLSEAVAVRNFTQVRRKAGKAIHATGLLAFPAIAILIPLGSALCTLIYADSSAGAYMLPLCISTLFLYYQITTSAILNGIGMQRHAAVVILAGGLIELFFTWCVGIKGIGIYAFLAGRIVSCALCAGISLLLIVRNLNIRMRRRNWFFIPSISACPAGLFANWLHMIFKAEQIAPIADVAICIGAAITIYLILLRAQGTSPARYLRTLIPKQQNP